MNDDIETAMSRTYYSLYWDDCAWPRNGWRIFEVSFSGRSLADSRTWPGRREGYPAAQKALEEFNLANELHEYFCPGCKNTTTRRKA